MNTRKCTVFLIKYKQVYTKIERVSESDCERKEMVFICIKSQTSFDNMSYINFLRRKILEVQKFVQFEDELNSLSCIR